MGKRVNYGDVAERYSAHRWALSWKIKPLIEAVARLPVPARIAEVGCGTADYLVALHDEYPNHHYHGIELSPEMLAKAKMRCPWASFVVADADQMLPIGPDSMHLIYLVDVLHHIEDVTRLFAESARVLRAKGALIVITDSEADIRARTLGHLFPETIQINLERYP